MRPTVTLATAVLLALGACAGGQEIGDESLLDFKEKEQLRLGQATPTPSAVNGAAPTAGAKQGVGSTPAPPKAPAEQPAIQVAIQSDEAGSAFDPSLVRVSVGSKVTWVNRDQVPRSVEADDGSFNSGPIAPGATWSWQANRTGRVAYHDGTRPYAVGFIDVA